MKGRVLVGAAILVGLTANGFGCSSESVQTEPRASRTRFAFPSRLSSQSTVVDDEGRIWIGSPITVFAEAAQLPTHGPTTSELNALSDDEYVERSKPIKGVFDGSGNAVEYRLAQVDALTRQRLLLAREKERNGVSMRSFGPGRNQEFTGLTPPPPPDGWTAQTSVSPPTKPSYDPFAGVAPKMIINEPGCDPPGPPVLFPACDHRTFITHALAFNWPYLTNVYFQGTTSGSGTLLGTFTAMSAAHVFHQAGGGGTWLPTKTWWVSLAHSTSGGTHQYTSTVPWMSSSGQFGCYSVTIPNSFALGFSEGDFAIVEFGCGLQPGSSSGWLNPAYGVQAHYTTAPIQMQAYDGEAPFPDQPGGVYTYSFPTLIRRNDASGTVALDTTFTFQLNHRLDHTRGASGGGLLQQLFASVGDPTLYWVADHHSGNSSTSFGRALTAGSWGFIQAWSLEL